MSDPRIDEESIDSLGSLERLAPFIGYVVRMSSSTAERVGVLQYVNYIYDNNTVAFSFLGNPEFVKLYTNKVFSMELFR